MANLAAGKQEGHPKGRIPMGAMQARGTDMGTDYEWGPEFFDFVTYVERLA